MRIEEIKKKYPEKSFFEMEESSYGKVKLKNIEDFLQICNEIGYIETESTGKEVEDMRLSALIDSFRRTHQDLPWYWEDDIRKNQSPELKQIIKKKSYVKFELVGIDKNVYYVESENILTEDERKKGFEALEKIMDDLLQEAIKAQEEEEQKIRDIVNQYKPQYANAKTFKDKDHIIRSVVSEIRMKLNIDGRSNEFASRTNIKNMLEDSLEK